MKTCKRCGVTKPLTEFNKQPACRDGYRPECKACRTPAPPLVERRRHLKRTYGMTLEEYDSRFAAQDGGCAICGTPPAAGRGLHVDHDHTTGQVRGLLCQPCNTMLGGAKDSAQTLAKGIAYLEG